jgi:homoserine kinase
MRVRVPGSIANLGPGFDVLAMAIDLWLEVEAEPSVHPDWRFEGEGAELVAAAPNPLSSLAMNGRVSNQIPVGVGLGSSAAARVAALSLLGIEGDELLATVTDAEGHPDNAAASIHGGVVAVVGGKVHRLPPPPLDVALFIARDPLPTERARQMLPDQVSRGDAVFNAAGLALLAHSLHTRDWSLLGEALEDRIHQPYRASLYPWVADVMKAAGEAGAHGAAVAGAGPSVFAFCPAGSGEPIALAMAAAAGAPGRPRVTRVVPSGRAIT